MVYGDACVAAEMFMRDIDLVLEATASKMRRAVGVRAGL
jgi:hypothetical protein